jgi:hypothetical protein
MAGSVPQGENIRSFAHGIGMSAAIETPLFCERVSIGLGYRGDPSELNPSKLGPHLIERCHFLLISS